MSKPICERLSRRLRWVLGLAILVGVSCYRVDRGNEQNVERADDRNAGRADAKNIEPTDGQEREPTDTPAEMPESSEPADTPAEMPESSEQTDTPAEMPEIIVPEHGVEMVLIPAGWFKMGSDHGHPDQAPAHKVWVDAFYMDRYEVTQEAFGKLEPVNGSHFKGPRRPTEMIGWGGAALYCNMRSRHEGLEPCYNKYGKCNFQASGYRLPTEAEWEYACRAGTDSVYGFGNAPHLLEKHAWYSRNAAKKTHPVGQKEPNPWGLYDMHGNVAEWCNDVYGKDYYGNSPEKNPRGPAEGDQRVLRGGSWNCSRQACGSAYRVGEDPGFSDACFARDAIGFRCVRKALPRGSADDAAGDDSSR